MRISFYRLCIIAFVGFISTSMLFGQDNPLMPTKTGTPFYFGPTLGYNRSLHSADLASFAVQDAPCPQFSNGSSNGFFVGLNAEYLLDGIKDSKYSIIARVMYNTMPALFESEGLENQTGGYPTRAYDATTGEQITVFSTTKHVNEVVYDMFTFEAQFKWIVFDNLGLVVGPSADFVMTSTQDQTMQLLTPTNARFIEQPGEVYRNDGRTFVAKEGDIPNSSGLRFAIKAGIQYEIPFQGFFVVPHFNYNMALTNLNADDDWRVNAIQVGVDVRFAF